MHDLPGAHGYHCATTIADDAMLATVFHDRRPLVTFGVATNDAVAEELWPALESQYLQLGDMPGIRAADFAAPARPLHVPWCAAMAIFATPEEALWIADFERCLAWAWIEGTHKQ